MPRIPSCEPERDGQLPRFFNFLRNVCVRVGGGDTCSFHESEPKGTLPRFSRLRRKVFAPIGIRQSRIRRRLTLVRRTLHDNTEVVIIKREQRPRVTKTEKSSEPAKTIEQKSINQQKQLNHVRHYRINQFALHSDGARLSLSHATSWRSQSLVL